MNGIDTGDQIRSYSQYGRLIRRGGWQAIAFNFLLEVVVVNSFLLQLWGESNWLTVKSQWQWRRLLATELIQHYDPLGVDDAYTLYENPVTNLLYLLSNPLILAHTAPYLSAYDRLSLASTSRAFRELVNHTSGVFRHLDLTQVRTAQFDIDGIDRSGEVWRNVHLDENLTEDECVYLSAFTCCTLILNGLSVTAELCHEIILDPAYNVRILSTRGVKNLNKRGCAGCGAAPEGMPVHKRTIASHRPLLSPPPLLSSSVKGATVTQSVLGSSVSFVARCIDCLRERCCASCNKWWCKECYQTPGAATELADTDAIVVDAEGGAWVQHQEHESHPKTKVRDGACFPNCTAGEVIDAQRVSLGQV
ncbi:ubiquitin fusion degradation protein [Colletotrichum incanum]|nr:ubiquitin fusion degradation protein [Colletotrichum incanum]